MSKNVKKVALVTGASSGIGEAVAEVLASAGYKVYGTSRRGGKAGERSFEMLSLDVTSDASAEAAVREVIRANGRIDLLVNNAGFGTWSAFADTPWHDVERLIDLDLRALTFLTHHFIGGMKARGRGRIMNVASFLAYAPCPDFATYGAAKAYVLSLSEALDHELKGSGVRVFVTCPGGTRTNFTEAAGQRLTKVGQRSLMTSEAVARLSVKKMLRGRRTYIPGWMNVLSGLFLRLVPRTFRPAFMRTAMGAGVEKPKLGRA